MNLVHQELIDIWHHQFQDDEDIRMPLISAPLQGDRLLFVGMNPSWPDSLEKKETQRTFFHWHNRNSFDFEKAIQFEHYVRYKKPSPYFAKFAAIAHYVGVEWEAIDLYFFREKSQAQFIRAIEDKWDKFGTAQLRLSCRLIREAQPRVIVVANAYASGIFEGEFKPEFSTLHGCHMTQVGGRQVPTFLASMLTGQRAMDTYSQQRLCWHIKKVYGEIYGKVGAE